jgi:alpha-D-xyloside xylohydrolase
MLRAMPLEFPNDPAAAALDRQYMFGGNLLVAPIFNEEGIAEFYLPEGDWVDIISGETFTGKQFYTKQYSYMALPLLAKANSIIGYGNFETDFEYDYLSGTEFVIYNLAEGNTATANIYDTEANLLFTLTATNKNGVIEINHTETDKDFRVKVFGKDGAGFAPNRD